MTQLELWPAPTGGPCPPVPYVVVSLDLSRISHPDHRTDARGVHYVRANCPADALLEAELDMEEGEVALVAFTPEELRHWARRLADVPPRLPVAAGGSHGGATGRGVGNRVAYLVVSCDLREVNDEREELLGEYQIHLAHAADADAAAECVKADLHPCAVALPGFRAADLSAIAEECMRVGPS